MCTIDKNVLISYIQFYQYFVWCIYVYLYSKSEPDLHNKNICIFLFVAQLIKQLYHNMVTLLRAKPIEYYGISHALPRCKKCSSYKQLRECDKEKVFSSQQLLYC